MPGATFGTDIYMTNFTKKISPHFCKYDIHPNLITIISIIINIFLFCFLRCNSKISKIVIFAHYLLDNLDGSIARECRQKSHIGGYLDSFNDIFFTSMILLHLVSKYYFKSNIHFKVQYLILIMIILTILSSKVIDLENHEINNPIMLYISNNSLIIFIILMIIV